MIYESGFVLSNGERERESSNGTASIHLTHENLKTLR